MAAYSMIHVLTRHQRETDGTRWQASHYTSAGASVNERLHIQSMLLKLLLHLSKLSSAPGRRALTTSYISTHPYVRLRHALCLERQSSVLWLALFVSCRERCF